MACTYPFLKLGIVLLLLSFLGGSSSAQELSLLWETEPVLTTIESAIYDPENEMIYTANINGHFMDKDGNGFISKVDLEGNVIEANWITGLDAPTGLGIYQGKLYTSDIDRIIEIDINKGEISNIYPVEGANAFNDIDVGSDGTVYCSDTGGNQIFTLKSNKVSTLIQDIDTPNGLYVQGDQLMVTRWTPKSVDVLDQKTKQLSAFAQGIEGPDGLEPVGDGTFLASGFFGLLYHVMEDGTLSLLLNTKVDEIKSADIEYIPSKGLILVPTMDGNKLMAYRFPNKSP